MFNFIFNSSAYKPEPHNIVVDRVIAEFIFDNKFKTKLKEIHAAVPKKYWQNYVQNLKANRSYVWRNNTWQLTEKSELPLFEIIKHGVNL